MKINYRKSLSLIIIAFFLSITITLSDVSTVIAGDAGDIADEISAVYPYIDDSYIYSEDSKTDRDYVADARNALAEFADKQQYSGDWNADWESVIDPLLKAEVISRFDGEDDTAKKANAKTAFIEFAAGLGDIYYSTDPATLEARLTAFKDDPGHKDTFQRLFGTEVTVDDLYQLIINTRDEFPNVVDSSDVEDLAFNSNQNLVDKMPMLTKEAMQAALAYSPLDGKLAPLGWSIDLLIDQKTVLADIIDAEHKAELAMGKAAVRYKSELYEYVDESTQTHLSKNPQDQEVYVELTSGDLPVEFRLQIMGKSATTLVNWESSNSAVASLDQTELDETGYPILTPQSAGSCTITAYRYDETGYPEGTADKDWILKINVSVSSGTTPGPGPQPEPELETVILSGTAPSPFNVEDTYLLSNFTVTGKDEDGNDYDISGSTKTWNSSDPSVIAISGASLEAMQEGTADITVTVDGIQSNPITVTVNAAAELKTVELSGEPPSPFKVGDTCPLSDFTVTGKDQDGNDFDISESTETWNSSDSSVAAVSGNSLEAVGAGTATITVTVDDIESNPLAIIVSSADAELTTLVLEGTVPSPFNVGDTFALGNFTVEGYDQYEEAFAIDDQDIEWSSSNTSVLAVNAGNIEAVAEGTADIKAVIGEIESNAITVEVSKPQAAISAVTLSAADKTPVNGTFYLRQGDTLTVDITLEEADDLGGLSVAVGNWKTLTEADFVKQADKQYRWTYNVSAADQMRAARVTAVLNESTAASSSKVAFDNQSEIIVVFSPQNNTTVGADVEVKVSVLCETTTSTALLELSNGEIVDMDKDMAGMFSAVYTTREADNGPLTGSVTITDLAGNTATEDPAVSFEVDTVAPEISLNQIQEGDVNQDNGNATLSGTIDEDGLVIEVYKILGNDKHILISDPGLVSAGNSFSLTVNLGQGPNRFYALSSDTAGNEGSSSTVTYDYDTKGPVFTITVTPSGENRDITVSASEDVMAGTLGYELRFDGSVQEFTLTEDSANRQWSGSFSPVDVESIDFVVEGEDLTGNRGVGIYTATNVIASQGATLENEDVIILIPSNALGEDTPVEISDTDEGTQDLINAGTNVAKTVDLRPDGTVFSQPVRITLPYDPGITDTNKIRILYLNKTDPDNPYWEDMTDRIVDIDEINHTVTFETDHFSLYASASDTTPPELQISGPVNHSYHNASTVTVTGTTEINALGIDIGITVNGNPAGAMTSTDGSFSLDVDLEANQANTIEISATDPADNSSTRTITVIQESDTPVISISSLPVTPTTDESVSISGTVSPGDMQHVSWSSEAGNGSIELQADGSFTIADIPLQEGVNNIIITAISHSGKISNETITITRVLEPPVVSVAAPMASPAAGTYSSTRTVTLSTTTAGANIYYTLDGSTPSTASKLYTAALTIRSSTTVKAIAVKSGVSSAAATFAYTISTSSGGGGSALSTTKTINRDGGKISKFGAVIDVPAGALSGSARVTLEKVRKTSGLPLEANRKLISDVVEITRDTPGKFKKPIKITLSFDKTEVDTSKYDISLFYLAASAERWVELDNIQIDLARAEVSGQVDHLSKFAVLATSKIEEGTVLSDISGHWAEANIIELVSAEAISGYPDGSFRPDRTISRAEFATVLVKAYKLAAQSGKVFSDTSNHWAKTYIATAAANGIITGYNDSEFGPDDLITREQMAVMIVRAAELDKTSGAKTFKDSGDIASWAADAVSIAVQHNIITGYPDNSFKPKDNASRAEAVTTIVRALN